MTFNEWVSPLNDAYNNISGYPKFVIMKFFGEMSGVAPGTRVGQTLQTFTTAKKYLLLGARCVIEYWASGRAGGSWAQATLYDDVIPVVQNAVYAETTTNRILDIYMPLNGYPVNSGRTLKLGGEIDNKHTTQSAGGSFTITLYAVREA